jgi:hypothetical protein
LCEAWIYLIKDNDTVKLSSKELTMMISSGGGNAGLELNPEEFKMISSQEGQFYFNTGQGQFTISPASGSEIVVDGKSSLISMSIDAGQDEIILDNNNQSITLKKGGSAKVYLNGGDSSLTLSSDNNAITLKADELEWLSVTVCEDGNTSTKQVLVKKS